jgi:hypothetical protein
MFYQPVYQWIMFSFGFIWLASLFGWIVSDRSVYPSAIMVLSSSALAILSLLLPFVVMR